jgi:hypothetical protein
MGPGRPERGGDSSSGHVCPLQSLTRVRPLAVQAKALSAHSRVSSQVLVGLDELALNNENPGASDSPGPGSRMPTPESDSCDASPDQAGHCQDVPGRARVASWARHSACSLYNVAFVSKHLRLKYDARL